MKQGVEHAWKLLAARPPDQVCRAAGATYADGSYALPSLGQTLTITPDARTIEGRTPVAELLLARFRYFSELAALYYLAGAQPEMPTGRFVKPVDMKAGQIYFTGSHVLPLDRVAGRFGARREALGEATAALDAAPLDIGDAAVRLLPFPKIPLALVVWLGDDEFPARADLLFDAGCETHLPADVIWSAAMMTVLTTLSLD